jgi:hypothetical protein
MRFIFIEQNKATVGEGIMNIFSLNRLVALTLGVTLALLGGVAEVQALDNNSFRSADVWPAEGNVRCSDYFSNAIIEEASTSNLGDHADYPDLDPPVIGDGATGDTNPLDPDQDPQETVHFTINDDGTEITSFTASTRINAVIVKASKRVNVFVEPAGGVFTDAGIRLDDGEPIAAVAFCYGVSYFQSETLVDMPSCFADADGDGTPDNGDFDGCESGEKFECDLHSNDITGVSVDCCACNEEGAHACDPSLPLNDPNACDFVLRDFAQILFGLNGNVACYPTDDGDRCYSWTPRR